MATSLVYYSYLCGSCRDLSFHHLKKHHNLNILLKQKDLSFLLEFYLFHGHRNLKNLQLFSYDLLLIRVLCH